MRHTVTNITVSVPDDVYRAARIRAAEKGVSVSVLVAEYLRSLSKHDAEFARDLNDGQDYAGVRVENPFREAS